MHVGVDEAGQDKPAGMVRAGQSGRRRRLHRGDAAPFDEQPVIGTEAHRGGLSLAPGRLGREVEQVAARIARDAFIIAPPPGAGPTTLPRHLAHLLAQPAVRRRACVSSCQSW